MPPTVQRLAPSMALSVVWRNELGGLTFEGVRSDERVFLKWAPADAGLDLCAEAARLAWAGGFTAVPRVLDYTIDDEGECLVTAALPGRNAAEDRWRAEPATAVAAIGEGLRAFHDALPVESCPFAWSVEARAQQALRRATAGEQRPADWHPIHQHLSVVDALAALAEPPPVVDVVVCHGDSCAPNTLIDDEGRWSGHVDLGALGMADRWADIAIATWSTEWNYGPGWEAHLLAAYGIDRDPERSAYYRLLWDLT